MAWSSTQLIAGGIAGNAYLGITGSAAMRFLRTPGLQEASQGSDLEGKMNSQNDAKQLVMSCVNAINQEDFKKARQYVSDGISFRGSYGFASRG
jgi:hypothetical protein